MAEENNVLVNILNVLKENLGVSKEHKEISKKIEKESLSKKEKRFYQILTIIIAFITLIVVIIGGGIIISLFDDNSENNLNISISPSEIILNYDKDIDFEINFTNVGKKDINNFDILKIDLYRDERGELVYKRQIKVPWQNKDYSISCRNGWIEDNGPNLKVGDSCVVKVDMYSCPECFDDNDKKVYFLIYIDSVPPIENQMVNIPIY